MIETQNKIGKNLKIVFLGGLEEVGRNMAFLEFDNNILIIDAGLQFPEEDMPGIDYIIPNIDYLKSKKEQIRGIIITHGHYDHIGAIPYIIDQLGNPPIFATALARGIILKRQEDFPGASLKIEVIKPEDKIKLGCFEVEFFHQNHNIPDSCGIFIKTPVGNIVHTGDFKFDLTPIGDKPVNFGKIAEIGNRNILVLMSESTGAENPGHALSEKTIMENLDSIFRGAPGRIIAATFASLISRIQQLIYLSEKYGRHIAIDGYSMKSNVEIAKALGYLKFSKKGTLIPLKDVDKYHPSKIVILCTGAQGEDKAVLMRIANKEHKFIKIQKDDTIVFSSSVVPGNERTVQSLKDLLSRQNARIFHYKMMDIHAGGHAQQEDLKMMISLIRPKFFIPIYGYHYMLKAHANLAKEVGIPDKNIVVADNGDVIEVNEKQIFVSKEKIPANYVMVDGLGIGDVGEIVLRDRQVMSKDGMFVVIATIDTTTGKVRGEPDIISRGFIYMRQSKELLSETRKLIKNVVEKSIGIGQSINTAYIKDNLRDKIGEYLYLKTQRRPMVLPVVIEI